MAKKQILVVDDEKDIVEFLTQLLEDNGYEVTAAYDGVQAMEMVLKSRPDLILLDLQMPEETGTGLYPQAPPQEGVQGHPRHRDQRIGGQLPGGQQIGAGTRQTA